jgi:hypothetical protein
MRHAAMPEPARISLFLFLNRNSSIDLRVLDSEPESDFTDQSGKKNARTVTQKKLKDKL